MLVVLWRLRYKLSLRDLAKMFLIRGFEFTHEAVRDWEERFAPLITGELRCRRKDKAGCSWYVDETYVKVGGKWHYLYRAVDRDGNLVDSMWSEHRNMDATKRFFSQAKDVVGIQTPARNYLRGVIGAALARDSTVKTVEILRENDPFIDEVTDGAAAYANEKGLRVVYNGSYSSDAQDVSLLLRDVKTHNPDLLLSSGHLQDSLLIVRQAKQIGVSPKNNGVHSRSFFARVSPES